MLPDIYTFIVLLFLLLVGTADCIKCYRESWFLENQGKTPEIVECGAHCHFCAKTVNDFWIDGKGTEIFERWCGCKAEFECYGDGMYSFNSIIDEYAVAHCCSEDLCNPANTMPMASLVITSILVILL